MGITLIILILVKAKNREGFRKKAVLAALALVVIGGFAVFGKGLLDIRRLKSERDGILAFNKSLEDENRGLEGSIELLKTDKRYIGRIARSEFGMIGKNEVVYRIENEMPRP